MAMPSHTSPLPSPLPHLLSSDSLLPAVRAHSAGGVWVAAHDSSERRWAAVHVWVEQVRAAGAWRLPGPPHALARSGHAGQAHCAGVRRVAAFSCSGCGWRGVRVGMEQIRAGGSGQLGGPVLAPADREHFRGQLCVCCVRTEGGKGGIDGKGKGWKRGGVLRGNGFHGSHASVLPLLHCSPTPHIHTFSPSLPTSHLPLFASVPLLTLVSSLCSIPPPLPPFPQTLWRQRVVAVACGWRHTVVLSEGGNVFSWGRATSGQLGHGDTTDRNLPKRVEAISADGDRCRHISGPGGKDVAAAAHAEVPDAAATWVSPAERYAVVPGEKAGEDDASVPDADSKRLKA
ncbi:unnamed protein product [Closterium sp. NIES-53]